MKWLVFLHSFDCQYAEMASLAWDKQVLSDQSSFPVQATSQPGRAEQNDADHKDESEQKEIGQAWIKQPSRLAIVW